ncbi:MAG: ATP-binding cassette domain-containing protein, partial [Acetatifactor sp.]|nr:ATP-binding cassette domain-containing protein [Acetatifactor sp.]
YIETQDKRYDTVIGDGSQALSSGQDQRICIASALYQGSGILLFDEPTSNLDAESIDIFLDTLDRVAADRICIVVTHDPRVLERCNQVYEVEKGALERV